MKDGKLTYAALILLGAKKTIKEKLPQAKTILEFRNAEAQIAHSCYRPSGLLYGTFGW